MVPPNFIPPRLTPQQQELLNRPPNEQLRVMRYGKFESDTWPSQFWQNVKGELRTYWFVLLIPVIILVDALCIAHSFVLFFALNAGAMLAIIVYVGIFWIVSDRQIKAIQSSIESGLQDIKNGILTTDEARQHTYPTAFEYEASQSVEEPSCIDYEQPQAHYPAMED